MSIDFSRTRERLANFDFQRLFVEELGWAQPSARHPVEMAVKDRLFARRQIAGLGGVVVLEVTTKEGSIPDAKSRMAIHKEISELHHENVLIFVDKQRTQSLWYWVKRENGKALPRDHVYVKGQPGDLFLSKLAGMYFDISELDEKGDAHIVEVASRLKKALDVERVTKKFYGEFQDQHIAFLDLIKGVADERQRRWYASVLLNRLMFIWFLQRKGFVDDGDTEYLQGKLAESKKIGKDRFFRGFLRLLFFEGLAKPEDTRSTEARRVLGVIKYLNGGLFLPHQVEQTNPGLDVPDKAFENLFGLFQRYSWNLNDTPGGLDNEINPDVLGYIFEKYINQKAFGAYYTRSEITEYLCERTIHRLILAAINPSDVDRAVAGVRIREFSSMAELLMGLDAGTCRRLLFEVLPKLSLLDPACGSGAFLVAAMKTLINVYSAVIGKIKFLNDRNLSEWLAKTEREHKSVGYFVKKAIITDNLYGVDIMEEAAEIARLRLFLALVAAAESVDQLEPLPNIDFNILTGNSLIGLMRVDDKDFNARHSQSDLFRPDYKQVLAEKDRLVQMYRYAGKVADDLTALRDEIEAKKADAKVVLDEILLAEFAQHGIKFEQPSWDAKNGVPGKSTKRRLTLEDLRNLRPFHWGYEFDRVLGERGGFDAIITNPPWEIFKPNGKEFLQEFSNLVTKKKMTIHDFENTQAKLLRDPEIREAWLEYLGSFPHQSSWFRSASQFKNQISIVSGKKAGSDINLYKLFTEQCFNLLRPRGECGIVIPSGIYTDLGSKQLREMLFGETQVTGLFGFENRKQIFENVDSRFKFVVLTFEKGGNTTAFPATFMRHSVEELEGFPKIGATTMSVDLIRRLSPDALSIMEVKSPLEVCIAEKMLTFPALGGNTGAGWKLRLGNEFHMTGDSDLFKTTRGSGRLPFFEGKMIHQFTHQFTEGRYFVSEKEGRRRLLGREADEGQELPYEGYRLVHRSIGRNTDERTMIASVLPRRVFFGHSLNASVSNHSGQDLLFLVAMLDSFSIDFALRQSVTANLTMFFVYQLHVPRPSVSDSRFKAVVDRSARLICTTPEFDDLAREAGLKSHKDGAIDSEDRARLRAELDGLVANLYGLTEEEFTYILTTFPLVGEGVKVAALDAYREFAPKTADQEVATLIAAGESAALEFKASARWDFKESRINRVLEQVAVKTVAAFMNMEVGGKLLIGVDDDGKVIGLENDLRTLGKKPSRDGYENWLTTLLLSELGKDCAPLISISFHDMAGLDACRVAVKPSPRPVYVRDGVAEHLYIRAGNSTRLLTTREAVEYIKQRWK